MAHEPGRNVIFLMCPPRSGSSLTTMLLHSHSQIFATQEMWFLMRLYDLQAPVARPYGGTGILQRFYNGMLTNEQFEGACRAFAEQIYNGFCAQGDAVYVVDKSPRYYYILEFLDRLFPAARRIWLIRNPLAVLASYKRMEAKEAKEGQALQMDRWLRREPFSIKAADLTIGLQRYADYFHGAPDQAFHRLHYEQLVARPEAEMEKLCAYLGLPYEAGMITYGQPANKVKADLFYSMGVGDPSLGNYSRPHQEAVHSWKETLTRPEAEGYCRVLGAALFRRLGYEEVLAEVEQWTGTRIPEAGDEELQVQQRKQLQEASGCRWQAGYSMQLQPGTADLQQSGTAALQQVEVAELTQAHVAEALQGQQPETKQARVTDGSAAQLQMMVHALEQRLAHSYEERERLRERLQRQQRTIRRVQRLVPFGAQLSRLAARYLLSRGGRT